MKALIVSNLFPVPIHRERSTFNEQQFRALARLAELRVIAPIAWTEERKRGTAALPKGRSETLWGSVHCEYPRYLFPPRVLRGRQGACMFWSIAGAFGRALKDFGPEVVLGSWAYPDGWAAVRLARRAGLPVALKVHGSDLLELDLYPGRRPGTSEALKGADRVVAVSRHLADEAIALGARPDRVDVVRNGTDRERFRPLDRDSARAKVGAGPGPLVLSVGLLAPIKGHDVLIAALGLLARRGASFQGAIAGAGGLEQALRDQARAEGLEGRLRFLGAVPHAELPLWMNAADVLALPSRSEGMPNVLLEATACGLPWVASAVGGVPELARSPGQRLVPPGRPEALADALALALGEPRPLPPGADVLVSWEESAAGLARSLERAIADHRAAP